MLLNTNIFASARRTEPAELNSYSEKLLSRLSIDVEWFSMLTVTPGNAPALPAIGQVIVLYIVKGTGSLHWSDGAIVLREGMVVAIPRQLQTVLRGSKCDGVYETAGETHGTSGGDSADEAGDMVVASAVVSASAGPGLGYFESLKFPLVEDTDDALLALIFGAILSELDTPGIGSKCIVEALMKQVLIVLLRRTLACQTVATPLYLTVANPSLAQVINTIQDSHAERLSIPGLGRMVGMTPLELTREFERVFGESLLDYILGVRLYQATSLLMQTDLPIKCIAASVGFASRSHFSRAFRKRQGQDPTTFRKNGAEPLEVLQLRDESQLCATI